MNPNIKQALSVLAYLALVFGMISVSPKDVYDDWNGWRSGYGANFSVIVEDEEVPTLFSIHRYGEEEVVVTINKYCSLFRQSQVTTIFSRSATYDTHGLMWGRNCDGSRFDPPERSTTFARSYLYKVEPPAWLIELLVERSPLLEKEFRSIWGPY